MGQPITQAQAVDKAAGKRKEFEAKVEQMATLVETLLEKDAKKVSKDILGILKNLVVAAVEAYSLANEIAVLRNTFGFHEPKEEGRKLKRPAF